MCFCLSLFFCLQMTRRYGDESISQQHPPITLRVSTGTALFVYVITNPFFSSRNTQRQHSKLTTPSFRNEKKMKMTIVIIITYY